MFRALNFRNEHGIPRIVPPVVSHVIGAGTADIAERFVLFSPHGRTILRAQDGDLRGYVP